MADLSLQTIFGPLSVPLIGYSRLEILLVEYVMNKTPLSYSDKKASEMMSDLWKEAIFNQRA